MTVSCFVYYRVSPGHLCEAGRAAQQTVDRVVNLTGVTGQLMTKVNEPLLWMEVYENIGDPTAFLSAMQQCFEQSGLVRWLEGDRQRHTEMFQTAGVQTEAT